HHLEKDALVIANSLSEPFEKYQESEASANDLQRVIATFQHDTTYEYTFTDHDRRVIGYSSENQTMPTTLPRTPEFNIRPSERIGADIRADADGVSQLYVASEIIYENRVIGYLVLSKPMGEAYAEVTQRWMGLGMATLPVLLLVFIASWWVAKTISHPLKALRDSALKIADGALDTRVAVISTDEVGELGKTLNYMATQLEEFIETQRSFVSNAAHELRTPLMMLKLRAEALQDATLPDEERTAYLHEIGQEVEHMAKLVSALLTLARLDEG
ncbi:MAG TPA: HAMP domain-containing protein, partial [Aggregatilineales bacterium]|nr:HAMP domain-containing protein [Aggregatilineales bacterium]